MDFKSSYRMEAVYFQKLKSDIDIAKSLMNDGNTEEARALLENAVDVNGAVLLLYRNLGDVWGELGSQIQKTNEALKELKETTEDYHKELNEKIDDVNNTIIRLLNALEDRIAAVERDLATMSRVKILSLVNENGTYHIYDGTTEIGFDEISSMISFPHDVIIRGVVNGEEGVFQLREFDTDETSGSFEFYSTGLANNVVNEITVTVLPDDSVTVATVTQTMKEYLAGNGINISSNDEISVDFDVVQEKLTAGSGISIDPDTKEITNTAPGANYTGGDGINILNDVVNNLNPHYADSTNSENIPDFSDFSSFSKMGAHGAYIHTTKSVTLTRDYKFMQLPSQYVSGSSLNSLISGISDSVLPDGHYCLSVRSSIGIGGAGLRVAKEGFAVFKKENNLFKLEYSNRLIPVAVSIESERFNISNLSGSSLGAHRDVLFTTTQSLPTGWNSTALLNYLGLFINSFNKSGTLLY